MPVTDADTKTQRLLELQMLFWRNPNRSLRTAEVAAHLGVTERTARNYLTEFTASGRLPLWKDGWEWRLVEGARMDLLPVNLDLEEGAQLYLAARLLAKHSDEPDPTVRSALVKLISAMPETLTGHLERLAGALPTRADSAYADTFRAIVYGWATRRIVDLEYHPLKARPYRARFRPYLLEPSAIGYTIYAIGHSDPPGALRTYKLERISGATMTDEPFDLPADFDGLELLQRAWGVMYGEELQTVTLRFAAGRAAHRVKETVWHPSQELRDLEDGRLEWSAQVGDWLEMLPWIRGWGADVEVVGPEELREELVGQARRLVRQYRISMRQPDRQSERLLRCWGKVKRHSPEFHPALFHMLDVGHVAQKLLRPPASPRWRNTLADALGTEPEMLNAWLPYVIAMHDIGKVSAAFQAQKEAQALRLESEGFVFKPWRRDLWVHHSQAGQVFAQDHSFAVDLPDSFRQVWVDMIGGHHGQFRPRSCIRETRLHMQQLEPAEWQQLREVGEGILRSCFLASGLYAFPAPRNISAATMALTGFTILCDWLGSDERFFPPRPDWDLEGYLLASQSQAGRCLQAGEFLKPSFSVTPTAFAALFPDKHPPRPLQEAIDAIPQSILQDPCLAIIESPTGEGKTEAALALAHRLAQSHTCDELYYALPTTATSNQMFRRLQEHLHDHLALHLDARLIHGQAFLMEDDLQAEPLDNAQPEDRNAMVQWFTSNKRSILAPFGVGTVDQAELAALNVKHNALRLMGLAGKIVIFDEVHAYDTYMTSIVERLLGWLSALGSSVIVLSATIPQRQRAALLRAYGASLDTELEESEAYPSLLVSRPGHLTYHATPTAWQPERRIQVRKLHIADSAPQAKADWLLKTVAEGGCVCWITNTVDRAQRLFEALRPLAQHGSDVDLMLLHARFPLEDRGDLEQRVVERYGPNGHRPRRGIVIGTQVLEQSLDLDFDVMVSDMAPIDLLLQRVGRMQRHEIQRRPAAFSDKPCLWINAALKDGEIDVTVDRWIYDEFLLRQTWKKVEELDEFRLPADYRRLVETVYGVQEVAAGSPLAEPWDKLQKRQSHALAEARLRLIPEPDPEWSFCSRVARLTFEEDETRASWIVAQTRLGRESVHVIPLERSGEEARLTPTEEVIALDRVASKESQLRLLRRRLRLSHPGIVKAVKDQTLPVLFRESVRLRGHYPLWLENGLADFPVWEGKLVIMLDQHLGLVIRREKGG